MTETFSQEHNYLFEINQHINIKSELKHLYTNKQSHIIVFCGMGLTDELCNQINTLSELTLSSNIIIGVMDRNDLCDFKLNKCIHKIPMLCSDEEVPKGIGTFENYIFCELKSIAKYINDNNLHEYKYFTKIRKDVFLILDDFINYIYSVPSLTKKYPFITTDQATNLLRKFCISDMFFTIPLNLIDTIPYRVVPKKKYLFWWYFRHLKPHEIFKNDHQTEQWLWKHILNKFNIKFINNYSFDDYLGYLDKYILVLSTKQIGYFWNRSSNLYLHNWVRFPPNGRGLSISTKPLRNYTSYSSFIAPLFQKKDIINFFKLVRILIFIKKSLKLLITLPIYYIKYLVKR